MGKIVDRGKGKIEIIYGGAESPFMGIDATKSAGIFIQPNALAEATNVTVQDGYLSSVFVNYRWNFLYYNSTFVKLGDVTVFNTAGPGTGTPITPAVIQEFSFAYIVSTQVGGGIAVVEYRNGITNTATSTPLFYPSNPAVGPIATYTVNGVVYITAPGMSAIYAYTPAYTAGSSTLVPLTNYVGGAFLGELNGRLLCLCCDSLNTGSFVYSPFQIAWSAGEGNYSQWNPLVSGLVTGAGYNNLPDVADRIVGFFTVGPTGYIIRKQGITEITPLNSGIEPFDFNHMWASNKGIGSIYPYTVSQYGSLGAFVSDTGIYTLGYGGINTIHGKYWNQIHSNIVEYIQEAAQTGINNFIFNIFGTLCPIYVNDDSYLAYFITIPTPLETTGFSISIGNVLTQDWATVTSGTITGLSTSSTAPITPISQLAFYGTGIDQTIPVIMATFPTPNSNPPTLTLAGFSIDDTLVPSTTYPTSSTIQLQFPIEEIATFRDITITAIGIYAEVDSPIVLNPGTVTIAPVIQSNSQANTFFTSAVFTVTPGQLIVSYPNNNPFTGTYPQLSLTCSVAANQLALRLYKVVIFGTIDMSQSPG